MLRLAREGYPFIGGFLLLAALAWFGLGPLWALLPLALTGFMVYFFRDPERTTPHEPGFVSAADGRVVLIKPEHEGDYLKRDVMKISVFMSPLDVHVNRSPCDAEVLNVRHTPGSFMAAYRNEASWKNENTAILLGREGGNILIRQVAGSLARRTVCRVKPGERLKRGERFGIIKFSSRLDHYLPADVEVRVRPNQRVRAGETILAVPKEMV